MKHAREGRRATHVARVTKRQRTRAKHTQAMPIPRQCWLWYLLLSETSFERNLREKWSTMAGIRTRDFQAQFWKRVHNIRKHARQSKPPVTLPAAVCQGVCVEWEVGSAGSGIRSAEVRVGKEGGSTGG